MSRATSARRQLLVGGALGALAILTAAPASADTTPAPNAVVTSTPTASPSVVPSAPPSPSSSTSSTSSTSPTTSPSSPTTTPVVPGPTVKVVAATTPTGTAVDRASSFVVASLAGGDHVVGPFGPDLGQTADVALGLAAAGGQGPALAKVVAYLKANAAAYVHGDPSFGEKADANYAGPTGKLAVVAQVTGNDPTSFGGLDLLAELRTLASPTGRFLDDSAFGDFSNPLGQAFDVLALQRAGGAPRPTIDALVGAQCGDGGFPDAFGGTCASSADASGLALQALVAADSGCPAAAALAYLQAHQSADGSFTSSAVDPAKAPVANVNSTAYAALGLTAARASSAATVVYLRSVQNLDGGLPTIPSSSPSSNLFATAQALAALAARSFLTVGPAPLPAVAPVCDTATATPTTAPTPTATATASPTTSRSAVPTSSTATRPPTVTPSTASSTSSASTTSSSAVVAGTFTGAETPPPAVAAQGDLPRTGADLLTPVASGFVLLFLGLILLFASRRRAGRHA